MLDAAHHIFCLSLRQLHRLRRLEERAETLELWDGRQLFCQQRGSFNSQYQGKTIKVLSLNLMFIYSLTLINVLA